MTQNKTPFLTVIVPAYNVEQYLAQCLDSLVNQTMMGHKVIVVDDGATDKTGEIADRYMNQYPELITCIHQENHGLGAARNRALQDVVTPYVAFLDSDDWQNVMFVEKVYAALQKQETQPDIIFTLPWIYDAATRRVTPWYDKSLLEAMFFPNGGSEDAISRTLNINQDRRLYELEANTNRRVYRTQFLREIGFSFQEGVKWEDVRPHFHAIHTAKSCIAMKNVGFIYRINTGGQITAGGGASRLDIIPVFRETLDRALLENWDAKEIAYILRMMWSFSLWSISVTNTEYIAPLLQGLHQLIKSIPYKYFKIYFNLCSPQKKREMVITAIMRSPFYMILRDYRTRSFGMRVFDKIRGIVRRIKK